ncbi:MAG: V-type ATP synthase subunit I [Candidatus Ratteibacteria bacterium]
MISRIKKFTCFFLGEEEVLLKKLQKLGIVEIENISFEGFEKKKLTKDEIEDKIKKLEFLKNILSETEKKQANEKIIIDENEENKILETFSLENIYNENLKLYLDIEKRKRIIQKIEKLKEEVLPFINTDVIFSEVFNLSNFSFFVFSLPQKIRLESVSEDLYLEKIGEFQKDFLYILLFRKEKKEIAEGFLKEIGGKILYVRKWNKKIKEIFEKLEKIKLKNEQAILKIKKKLSEITEYKKEIFICYDYYKCLYEFVSTREKLGVSKFVKGITGWVSEKNIDILKKTIFEVYPESYLIIEEPKEGDNIPIILENNRFIEPFEVVTDLYGRPVYKNIDPTGPLSIFFAISFGFCLTDAGYGILLILISLILMKKFRFLPNFVKFLKLLFICGISTLIIGALTGGWFGDTLYKLPENYLFIKFLKKIILLNPLESGDKSTLFLLIALVIGYIQIIWGLILNLYNNIKRYPLKFCGEAISLLLIQILVGIIIVGYLKMKVLTKGAFYLLILSFIYLMYEKAKTQKELMLKGFWAIYGAYSVIAGNLLGDVLSYSRLFGLGLTTSVLGLVINQMVSMLKNIPYIGFFIASLVFIVGHIGNLIINLLGSYVHTSRLQYLEFFTKFFEGGGRVFKPFKEVRNYTLLKTERY